MIDAAGAIYVIGGSNFNGTTGTHLQDVWVSADGGARPDSVGGGGRGYWVGTQGVLGGYYRSTPRVEYPGTTWYYRE